MLKSERAEQMHLGGKVLGGWVTLVGVPNLPERGPTLKIAEVNL